MAKATTERLEETVQTRPSIDRRRENEIMSHERPPDWFESRAMSAWAEGIHDAIRRQVRVITTDGRELLNIGNGSGDTTTYPLEVNGQPVGSLEFSPALTDETFTRLVAKAVEAFQALAETRNSMTDLVHTTANQWRELSLLYRSADLLRVDQDQGVLASHLLQQAMRAARSSAGLVLHGIGEDPPIAVTSDTGAESLEELAAWGSELDEGVVVSGTGELERLGFAGKAPDQPSMVVPLRCRDRNFGSLVLQGSAARAPSAEDLKLASLLADQAGRAFDNLQLVDQVRDAERLKRELELAAEIQSSVLPAADAETEWLEFAGACVPAKWVGGDSFLFDEQGSGCVLAGVADVCGHGVSSALLMNAFASSIYAMSTIHAQPGRLLEATNDHLSARVGTTGMFVTAVLMRLDAGGELTIASAGHPEAIVIRPSGEVELIDCGDLPLGIMGGCGYQEEILHIEVGTVVVAYSDGVTEARAPDGQMYGTDRLVSLLRKVGPRIAGCGEIRTAVLEDVNAFRAGCEQDDDVTVIVLRRTK